MINLGLSLKSIDFKNILKFPRQLIIGLIAQILILPAIAFAIANLSGLSTEMKIGIMLIAACPGGAVSNLITYFLKGDVSLSVTLTTANSVLILFSLPAIIYFSLFHFLDQASYINISVAETILKVLLMIILPTILGMLIRHRNKIMAQKLESIFKYLSVILLALVYTLVIFEKNDGSISKVNEYLSVAPWVLLLNLAGMLTGYLLAKINRLDVSKQITLSVEVGIQNSALAITIASSTAFLGNHQMAIPAVVYGMFTFFSAVIFGLLIRKFTKKQQ